ncbi:MAG: hypothetical protein ACLTG4_00900 [Oscillospiraceae bacterium]
MKLMILDGNSIVNRAFYGIRMLNAPDGTPTNAVYGFLTIFQRILELEQPQAVCVAFDVHAPTFRHEQYALYKAQRKPMPEELVVQMPLLKQTLDHMGIQRLELAGWEADDLLGTVARRCEAAGWACEIVTGDKDASSSSRTPPTSATSRPAWARRRRSNTPEVFQCRVWL